MSWFELDAKWNGTCSTCSTSFPQGTSILWENNTKKTKHKNCNFKSNSSHQDKTSTHNSDSNIYHSSPYAKGKLSRITCGNYYTVGDSTKQESRKDDWSKMILDNKVQKGQHQENCRIAARTLSKFMFEKITQSHIDLVNQIDLVIPVPTDRWVPLFSRGVSIGSELASLLKKPFEKEILVKTKSINRKGLGNFRRTEIANESYAISNEIHLDNNIIKNKKILLVDDVLVGGSTTEKCAQLLIENGARQIQIICAVQSKYRG
jgi:pyrimidine operon attenuation protein/uracil phosphoribosyltransferase